MSADTPDDHATAHDDQCLRVGFMTTLGVNVGDEFIREGVRAVLDHFGVRYSPLYVNKHDAMSLCAPREDESEIVEDKFWDCDLFVQAGAPVYWNFVTDRRHSSLTSEWHQWLWSERILNRTAASQPLFVNLGAGSCQPWADTGDAFVNDPQCARFAQSAGERAALTTVRDPLAAHMLERLDVAHVSLACPALLAACRHARASTRPGLVGVNLMPLGAHYDLENGFDRDVWRSQCEQLCKTLRKTGRLMFVCHDRTEQEFAAELATGDERVFSSSNWRDYFDVYSACGVVLANRVHGALCAAGFGVPALIMGNDTRALIGEYIGLPIHRSGRIDCDEVAGWANEMLERGDVERARLLSLRSQALNEYVRLLRPVIEEASRRVQQNRSRRAEHRAPDASAHVAGRAAFYGWTRATGLAPAEGPYPQWSLPRVRWGLGPVTRLSFESSQGENRNLVMRCKPHQVADQELSVLLDGSPMGRRVFPNGEQFVDVVFPLTASGGAHEIEIRYRTWDASDPDRPLAILFEKLRIELSA